MKVTLNMNVAVGQMVCNTFCQEQQVSLSGCVYSTVGCVVVLLVRSFLNTYVSTRVWNRVLRRRGSTYLIAVVRLVLARERYQINR